MKRPTLSAPRIPAALKGKVFENLPFLRKKQGEGGPAFDPDDTSYLEPTGFQKRLPWIAVIAAYAFFFLSLGGVATYLILSEDEILAELAENRPKVTLPGDKITVRNLNETAAAEPSGEGTDGKTGDGGHQQISANDQAPGEQGQEAPAEGQAAAPTADGFGALLQPHPDPSLIEESAVGPLPVIGADGRMPWRVYSRPYGVLETRPRIAIVLTNLGINARRTEQAVQLPGPVTLAFAPYSRNVQDWIQKARDAGHEVLLTLPMEPRDFPRSDPGPFALMTSLDAEQNIRRLEWIMSRATGYVGLVSYQGSGFTANPRVIKPLMADMRSRGLLYLDGKQAAASIAVRSAGAAGVPAAQADIILDLELGRAAVLKQLKLAESLARANGSVIVMGHPYPVTLDRIRIWMRSLSENGFAVTPLSGIVAERNSS